MPENKRKKKGKIEIRERCGGEKKRKKEKKKKKKKKRNVWIKKNKEKKNKEEEIKIEKCHNNIFIINFKWWLILTNTDKKNI